MKTPKKLYQFHVANLREIDHAMDKIARSLRASISQNDEATVSAFMRLYALLLGTWAECRLRKLIYEPQGFIDTEREKIRAESTQLKQWQKAVEVAFRRQYKIPKAVLSSSVLPHSAHTRYDTLSEMLTNDLGSTIELRNKLAHGQWFYPLNNEGNDIAQEQMDALRNENLLSLQFKKALLEALSSAIHDLVVSKPTFERDFDNHLRVITETQRNLKNRDYKNWAESMREKYERGKVKKMSSSIL
ncbi:MAG: hypothetical protein IT312_08400 [Anaerolineales bacterium]|nr:hypothetical protein [Anaerolineales bacterium]